MFSYFAPCLGIDLGTVNTLVILRGSGIVLREPTVVAMKSNRKDIIAVGEEAKKMIGKTPGSIVAIHPMREGVIADFYTTEMMLRYFIRKILPQGLFVRRAPKLVVCVPSGITEIEKRAVEDAARAAGACDVLLLEEPMAAALGAGVDVGQAKGSMIVDIGGGTSEIAVISLGGIVTSKSLRVGGTHLDEAIVKYAKENLGMIIGESTAEQVKIELGSVGEKPKDTGAKEASMDIRGRSASTGLPVSMKITSSQVREALCAPVQSIINGIREVLEVTPPELSADIIYEGIVLSGGTSLLSGFNRLVAKATGMPVRRADTPLDSVALGAGIAMEQLEGSSPFMQDAVEEPII
jgi:rod shape-determining protein MreB and related proteins